MRKAPAPAEATTLDEIRAVLAHLPDADRDSAEAARARQRELTKPPGSLGDLEALDSAQVL